MNHQFRFLQIAIWLLVGLAIPYFGFAWLLSFHPPAGSPLPVWVVICIPFTVLGPDLSSLFAFLSLAILNCILWASIAYGVSALAYRAIGWKGVHA